jgi:uncharacterized protein DUF1592/uncharacterized protein DUF1588/uncharacterized protein DUF1585/uncharacterized protein DUF1587/uncharacterized protein DUF1595
VQRDKRILVSSIAAGGIAVAVAAGVVLYDKLAERRGQQSWTALKSYCTDCHNDAERAGGVVLEGVSPESVPLHAETFEAAVRKLRGRLMPPPGNPQPDQTLIDDFVAFAETSIDRASRNAHHAGHVPIQRLNRTEYAASVQDLLAVDIDPTQYLPTEIEVDGFENIAAALSVSPAFLEQYIGVARAVARLAVGEPTPKLASVYFPPPADTDQDEYVDGMPLGTRGGTRYTHNFPADGEYRITLTDLFEGGLYPRALETEHTVVILVDRNEVFRGKLGGAADLALVDRGGAPGRAELMQRFASIPVAITAGVHEVAVTFIERARASTDEPIGGFVSYGGFSFRGEMRVPRLIGGVEVKGPFSPTGISRTASRQKIFVCTPETAADERGCAERIAANLARRAYRRPVGQDDVDRLLPFYEAGRADRGSFDAGIEQLVTAVLASPDFLYRAIVPPQGADAEAYALTDLELASRLSFFLWSRGPDDQLLELASAGSLRDPDTLREQAQRMLADPRAEALVTNFALKWLNLDELDAVDPDERLFPNFSDELREDFATEIRLFLRSVLLEDHDVQELLASNQTFLNEELARHYGVSGVHGPQFRRVTLTDEARFGLLGKGAALLRTSYGDRTSPVLRGAWVLDKLMGTPPTPPPPNVVTDLTTPAGEKPKTMRVRLEQHRTDPTCSGCHSVIDPYGLSLDNFSVTGEWRDVDAQAGEPIDPTTVLPTGTAVSGPVELRKALLARGDQFVQALTQKLLMYAIGREIEYYDMPEVRAIVRDAAKHDYRLSAIVAGIVQSDAFRMQGPARASSAATPVVAQTDSAAD